MARRKTQEVSEVKDQAPMFNDKDIKALAYEKSIEVDRVYQALEDALSTAARKYYRTREPLEAVLDRAAGAVQIFAIKEIVENEDQIEDPQAQWTLDQARKVYPEAEIGGTIRLDHITKEVVDVVKDQNTQIRTYEAQKIDAEVEQGDEVKIPLTKPPDELGRIAAQSAKQVLYQKVREAEREKVFNEFKDKMGELENGYVKRFERGDMIIDLNGKTEGIIPRHHQSRAERYSQGDRIKAVIVDVHTQPKGPQVVLSRTDPRLLIKLFEMEVPEIYDGTVVIKGAVREPGERAKIAVMSRERDVDPVGACVGMKGSRVQSIIRELRGEKIDIIPWSDDVVSYAQNALAPAKITRVSVTSDEPSHRPHLDVIVDNDQLSLAIGKRGLNVRLAAELISAKIDIKSEEEVKGEVADALSAMLQEAMAESRAQTGVREIENMPDEWSQLLEDAGYDDLDSVINASVDDLTAIEGIDEETAAQIIELGRKHEQVDESGGGSEDSEDEDSEDGEESDEEDSDDEDADEEETEEDTEDAESGAEASDEQKAEASVE
jgi:N utilization substance protein A